MPAARYSDEFKEQVVREVIEKERTISSVASSYDLVPQTVGNWVARYKKEHATDQDRKKASESAEIAKLRAENRELRGENEFLKKAAAFVCPEREGSCGCSSVASGWCCVDDEGCGPSKSLCG